MSTTSTYPVVVDALLAGVNGAMTGTLGGVQAFEVPPTVEGAPELLVLGKVSWQGESVRIATIKADRKHRQEEWAVEFSLAVYGVEGSTPSEPKPARDRAFAILAAVEDLLADDVRVGLGATDVQWIEVQPTEAVPVPYEKGWAFHIVGQFVCHARLL